jgi:hypothetical protein
MSQTAERDFSIGPLFGMAIEYISLTFALELDREWITGQPEVTVVTRWDENAGLRRDAIRSQVIDALEAQGDKGDRQ